MYFWLDLNKFVMWCSKKTDKKGLSVLFLFFSFLFFIFNRQMLNGTLEKGCFLECIYCFYDIFYSFILTLVTPICLPQMILGHFILSCLILALKFFWRWTTTDWFSVIRSALFQRTFLCLMHPFLFPGIIDFQCNKNDILYILHLFPRTKLFQI